MKFQTIIAAINLEDDLARGVLATAIALAKRDDAKLWVVDVWMPLRYAMATGISDPLGATAMIPSAADLEADNEARLMQEKELQALCTEMDADAKALMLEGEPGKAIAQFAREKNADLIVVGTHQKGAWKALFSGAPSRDIVRDAPCAILLVPKAMIERTAKP